MIGLQHHWSVNAGVRGKQFKRYLDGEMWSEYTSTFAGADLLSRAWVRKVERRLELVIPCGGMGVWEGFFSHTPTRPHPHTMSKFSNLCTAQ